MARLDSPPPARFNFAQHLADRNRERAGKVAYVDDAGSLTYGELTQRVQRAAFGLLALGLRREERVLVCLHDTIDFPVAFLGALQAGIVPVCVNTLLTVDDYAYMLEHSRAQALVVSARIASGVAGRDAPLGRTKFAMSSSPERRWTCPPGRATSPHGSPRPTSPPPVRPPARDSIAFWLYSSGSTGRPKGTVHTHGNLYWTAETYGKHVLGLSEDDVVFSAAKLFFAYGLGNALTFPLSVGATTILMAERPTPRCGVQASASSASRRCSSACRRCTPRCSRHPICRRASDVALRLCVSAGEALPKELGERFAARFGCDLIDGIGSTEMLHIFLSNRPGRVKYGTTGEPVDGYDIELRGEDGRSRGRRRDRRPVHTRPERGAPVLGQSATRRARRSRASGPRAATSTCAAPTATTPMPAAATTC